MKSSTMFLVMLLLVGWAASQTDPGHPGADDDDPQPRSSGIPRFRPSQYVDPARGGNPPTTPTLVPAAAIHAALDDVVTQLDNAADPSQPDLSVSLGPEDDGKIFPSKNIQSRNTQCL